eukprot:GHVS01055814.1.p1 GENE.GHVS01055814.1~~GHVS01055814.1.p1  ORF type:complete len:531 (-),score=72.12 GHVS01055814.1:225-1742(-)
MVLTNWMAARCPAFCRTSSFLGAFRQPPLVFSSPLCLAATHRTITTEAMRVNSPLAAVDGEIADLLAKEKLRQKHSLCLIASENFAPRAVMEAVGSALMNKYSEGYPGGRYYGGNEFIDQIERLCMQRGLSAFHLDAEKWGVNVQALSGSPANFAALTALAGKGGRVMGLALPHGGHLSHGHQTPTKKISAVSEFFETMAYRLDEHTGLIDYDTLEVLAVHFRPKVIIAGTTAYSRFVDYERMRSIADKSGAYLLADMAHISGMVAAGVIPSPFEYADVVTTTTHKSLRGPRGALIFFRRGQRSVDKSGKPIMHDLEDKVNRTIFPGLQGGPHNHTIAGIAVALKEARSEEFKMYQQQVLANIRVAADTLIERGLDLVSGGTDNHMILVDLTRTGLTGAKAEKVCELVNIVLNKNTVPKDKSAMNPSGIRIGSPAMTSRGLTEAEFKQVGHFIADAIDLGLDIQKSSGPKLLDFVEYMRNAEPPQIAQLRKEVEDFCGGFPTVGL